MAKITSQTEFEGSGRRAKGTVAIESLQDRGLSLRFSHHGKRYRLALGFSDTAPNRRAAQKIASDIERDIAYHEFDETLRRYKPQLQDAGMAITPAELFEHYIEFKRKHVKPGTIFSYNSTKAALALFFKAKPARSVIPEDTEKFITWYSGSGLVDRVQRERVRLVKSAWDWAIEQELTAGKNPWVGTATKVKVAPKQPPQPFTREEISAIIEAFEDDHYYHPYAAYVAFLFGTGCRTSEAIGLLWKHVSPDCSSVWIGETLTRGVRQSTKTNRARTVPLTEKLQNLLLKRRPLKPDPDALVFLGPRGNPIRDNDFRRRAWTTILDRLGIDYRKPYLTRSSLISHALDMGHSPLEVAQLTGHNVETLYQNYAGNVKSKPKLPEI
jgi:integrase